KYHVVRKIFYVASIFGGAASRKNGKPGEVSSTAGEVSPTAGYFSPTTSLLTAPSRPSTEHQYLGALQQV
ncbi:MAG: hypothetical protein U0L68_01080, partial [Prevotellamassilia sp.]|nr:hypothetical protein [Prevotellamassilia sp.]